MTTGVPLPRAELFHMSIMTPVRWGASFSKRRVSSSSGFVEGLVEGSGGWSVVCGGVVVRGRRGLCDLSGLTSFFLSLGLVGDL